MLTADLPCRVQDPDLETDLSTVATAGPNIGHLADVWDAGAAQAECRATHSERTHRE